MDLNAIQSLISTLGFPIVMVIALAWFIWKIWTKTQEQNDIREGKLYEVIGNAQAQNEALSKTNSEFITILNTYKTDLETIKSDVAEIKGATKVNN